MAVKNGNLTVFGTETEFNGVLEFTDSLVITGSFTGTINATGSLEVEKTSECKVDKIIAKSVVVYGKVTGDIEGRERVELCNGSSVTGNIKTARLRIADDVDFEGSISMIDEVPDEDIFATASKEYKDSLILRINEAR